MPIHDLHPESIQAIADAVGKHFDSDLVRQLMSLSTHLNDKDFGKIIRLVLSLSADTAEHLELRHPSKAELTLATNFLKRNVRLLHLSVGPLGSRFLANEEIRIVEAANSNANVARIHLDGIDLTRLGALLDVLVNGSTLREVFLSSEASNFPKILQAKHSIRMVLNAFKHNMSLKSLYVDFCRTLSHGPSIEGSLGEFVTTNTVLERLAIPLCVSTPASVGNHTVALMMRNTSLQMFSTSPSTDIVRASPQMFSTSPSINIAHVCSRNRDLKTLCRTLVSVCRSIAGEGFQGVGDMRFRAHLFSYFLPVDCVPAKYFLDTGLVARQPQSPRLVKDVGGDVGDHSDAKPISSTITDSEASEGTADRDLSRIVHTSAAERHHLHGAVEISDQGEEGKRVAIEESLADANDHDNDQLMRGLSASKADIQEKGAPLSGDGVVVLRLTNRSRSQEVRSAILRSPALALALQSVTDAGCSHVLDFAGGALSLVPLTQQQVEESEIEVREYHIIGLAEHVQHVREALKSICKKRRPQVNVSEIESLLKRGRHNEVESSASRDPWPSNNETPYLPTQGDVAMNEEMLHEDDGEPVDVIPECMLDLRTDSSIGFPAAPYRIY